MDKQLAKRILHKLLHKGSSVLTITQYAKFHPAFGVDRVSKVRVFCIDTTEGKLQQREITCEAKAACLYNEDIPFGDRPDETDSILLDGGGYNPGFDVVSSVSWLLFQTTYGLEHVDR
jgi:hypothetical protein